MVCVLLEDNVDCDLECKNGDIDDDTCTCQCRNLWSGTHCGMCF